MSSLENFNCRQPVLGNDQVVPDLVAQMKGTFQDTNRPHAMHWRDGWPYQHNLAAVRAVLDSQDQSAWDQNIYTRWLACLRELSGPTTDPRYPEVMRTRAWAMKTLNTQLASWTHLRHDTILYTKQSYTDFSQCVYPTGYVEPRVEFWAKLRATAKRAAELLADLQLEGSYHYPINPPGAAPTVFDPVTGDPSTEIREVKLAEIQSRQVDHLRKFASVVSRLEDLSAKELRQQCFTEEELQLVDKLMEDKPKAFGSGGPFAFTGWYPRLFYRMIYWSDQTFHPTYGADGSDTLVADVHTDVPSEGDPGGVLHEAVGRVNMLLLAVDNGNDRFICAGPVLSHYEFEVIGAPRRISDPEWGGAGGFFSSAGIIDGNFPADVPASRIEGLSPPSWTRDYLVPRPSE